MFLYVWFYFLTFCIFYIFLIDGAINGEFHGVILPLFSPINFCFPPVWLNSQLLMSFNLSIKKCVFSLYRLHKPMQTDVLVWTLFLSVVLILGGKSKILYLNFTGTQTLFCIPSYTKLNDSFCFEADESHRTTFIFFSRAWGKSW